MSFDNEKITHWLFHHLEDPLTLTYQSTCRSHLHLGTLIHQPFNTSSHTTPSGKIPFYHDILIHQSEGSFTLIYSIKSIHQMTLLPWWCNPHIRKPFLAWHNNPPFRRPFIHPPVSRTLYISNSPFTLTYQSISQKNPLLKHQSLYLDIPIHQLDDHFILPSSIHKSEDTLNQT